MKKTLIALAVVGMVLACAHAVFAATQTCVLLDAGYLSTAQGGIHKHAYGYVEVTSVPGGGADVTVLVCHGAKSYTYVVKSDHVVRGTFTTDERGNGMLQFSFAPSADDPDLGPWINIWETDGGLSPTGVYEPTHLLLCADETLVP
jgi:hypothetical protein